MVLSFRLSPRVNLYTSPNNRDIMIPHSPSPKRQAKTAVSLHSAELSALKNKAANSLKIAGCHFKTPVGVYV